MSWQMTEESLDDARILFCRSSMPTHTLGNLASRKVRFSEEQVLKKRDIAEMFWLE